MAVNVDVFSSPGCGKCGHAKDILRELVEELGEEKVSWRDVNILEDIDYAVELGVLSTPSIAIMESWFLRVCLHRSVCVKC